MAEEELRRMESRCIIRICLTGYGEEFDNKFIKDTNAWFEIKVKRYFQEIKELSFIRCNCLCYGWIWSSKSTLWKLGKVIGMAKIELLFLFTVFANSYYSDISAERKRRRSSSSIVNDKMFSSSLTKLGY